MITFVIFLVPFGPNVNLNLRANGRNIVGQQLPALLDVACCVRLQTLLHVVACCCELLRKVLKLVKPLAACKRTQQLSTWLGRATLGSICGGFKPCDGHGLEERV